MTLVIYLKTTLRYFTAPLAVGHSPPRPSSRDRTKKMIAFRFFKFLLVIKKLQSNNYKGYRDWLKSYKNCKKTKSPTYPFRFFLQNKIYHMQIELISIDKLIPYASNPRYNQVSVAKVAASISEFGWQQPIVVDNEMVVIAGHTRLLAAKQLKLDKVPVHIATNLTPAQIKAYRIGDNRLHEDAVWDNELLAIELGDLKATGFDLELIGFNPQELEQLLNVQDRDNTGKVKEFGATDFENFEHQCPKCGFEWNE